MEKSRKRMIIAIVVNVLVFALEVYAMYRGIKKNGPFGNFIFYTECSNLFAGIVCAACAVAEMRALRTGGELGRTLRWLKYMASCVLLMTLFVVTFVLVPMLENAGYPGFYMMYIDGVKLVTHLGAPLVVTISYVLFEAVRAMTFKQSLVGFAPTLLYAAVAYPCNILRLWDGPYPFFQVWNMPVWQSILWFVALFILAFSLCQIPRLLARRFGRKAAEAKKGS
jgi:hypothetical protein